jgi:P4 family phage/plasmid primase-like protien
MDYNKGDLYKYLSTYRVEKGCEFTHTSIANPMGSFYIPSEQIDNFYKLCTNAVINKDDLYLTEKHRDISPYLIDLDFRFELSDDNKRKYTIDTISLIVNLYYEKIKKYINIPELLEFYVMEKTGPSICKGLLKDGIHIVIPNIVTKPSVQFLIRNDILEDISLILDKLKLKNKYADVVDEAIIIQNNWQMYGSKKPNSEAYKITYIYKYSNIDGLTIKKIDEDDDHSKFIELMSIRNKYDTNIIKFEKKNTINEYEEKRIRKKMSINQIIQSNINSKKNISDNYEFADKLSELLSENRSNSYIDWIRVGWCLRNIDYRLMNKWIEFSKKSDKFEDGKCEQMWNFMREDGLGIGTLRLWAKNDNEIKYNELCNKDLSSLIFKSFSETHTDIAKVVHYMYKYNYVCVSNKMNLWYEFRNHKWISCDCGHTLRTKLSNEVVQEYQKRMNFYKQKEITCEADEREELNNKIKKIKGIINKLKTTPFKDNIIKESKELFYAEKFEEKLDSRCNLIGFENGVYDLDIDEFRDGRFEDYLSFSTGVNYTRYDETNANVIEMQEFISKIFTLPQMKKYVLTLLSSFLNGNIREEKFHIWTGCGSNGKSKFIELYERSFGDYCVKFPITLLTRKRAESNSATSELARAKGKRFGALQEPEENEKLNIGLMKELSGGDKIMARLIYKEPIEFKPQFKMILTCNHLPSVPSDDHGTWRRIRVVEFTSKFCENPDPENPNEFSMDKNLSYKFDEWKEHFMSLLIEYHKIYKLEGIEEPAEVLQCTLNYQKSNDIYLDFVTNELEYYELNTLMINDAYGCFKAWLGDNSQIKNVNKKDFIVGIEKIIGKSVEIKKNSSWKGIIFKSAILCETVDDLEKK